jgi:diguanylate cyclase (GGDEF)-like protein/PAS domain S-box-containing protein
MSPQFRLPAYLRSAARIPRRPGLRTVVVAPAVAVILGMALVVSNSVADELRRSATESAVHSVEAIVRGYVDPELEETSLDLGAIHDPAIDAQLERLTLSGEIRRINIWSRDGRIVYSSLAALRGRRFSIGPLIASAYSGESIARYAGGSVVGGGGGGGDVGGEVPGDGLPPMSGRFLELFVPIRGAVDGNPIGVYDVYQDARSIEQRIDGTRSGVFIVAVVASSLLVALIWLAFGGASRVLAGQNRRLQEQATTERLLLVDMQRNEERFRSLVQNASDGVVVLGEDGQIRYESPAVERILGRRAQERVGQSIRTDTHPDDRASLERGLADVAAVSGHEARVEFRARHADDSWRTLEAIAKNLLDDPAVGGVVVNYRDITERKTLEEQLRHQAFHDVLTGLENRFLFLDRLGHALARAGRGGRPTAVLFLDLDDFKAVNDRLGHAEGDRLLVAVGQRLKAVTRAGDTVARLGGDEFAIIVEETDPAEAGQAAARILKTLTPVFLIGDRQIVVRVSIGIAIQSADGADADELLRRADIAMYAAKASGGHRHVTYEPQLYDATVARMELKADLRGAMERGELHIAYQPIVDLESAAITGSEALMRWNHPEHGPVPPMEFIPLAEENGLILDLGRWIIETACHQTRAWQEATGRVGLTISVNLSGRQILDPDLVTDVRRILSESGLAPRNLTLEMTESVLVQDVEATVSTLGALKALGVRLAIDDFGTGYSSLSYLRQFPIDILKIDRSFITSLDGSKDSMALVRSILNLSSTLRLDTVAEGIEESEQREVLRGLGAQQGQGYLFARPMGPDDLGDLLAGRATTGSSETTSLKPSVTARRTTAGAARRNGRSRVIH